MEPGIPSISSAFPVRRSEIRRRSGGLSPRFEDDTAANSRPTYSPSFRKTLHLKPVPDLPEDDHHRPRSADAYSSAVSRSEGGGLLRPSPTDPTRSEERRFPVEHPLPPLPEYLNPENSTAACREIPFASIPLTPRPDGPPRFDSHGSQASKSSQRSVFSLFPRLPTPDFQVSGFKRNPFHQSIISPFSFFRSHTPDVTLKAASLSRPLSIRTTSTDSTVTAKSSSYISSSFTHPDGHKRHHTRTESSRSANSSEMSGILSGDETYSLFMATAPSRFTRKFPSPGSAVLGRSLPNPDAFEILAASETGDDLGVEKIGRWTGYKWCLLLSVLTVFGYAMTGLVCSILTWFGTHSLADVMWVADNDILIFITLASTLLLLTGLVGLTGTLLNSRAILAFYALLLWPSFVSVLVVGYTSYKREAFSLDRKLNMAWSQWYDDLGRLVIQESLHCCGFYNPLHEATFSKNCYPRTPLPGCKGKLFRFEQENLRMCWRLAFSLVPLHVVNITISLLCSNHVDKRFGKGLTPRAYRLSMADVRANADTILAQFADMKLPFEPSRTFLHVTDREDRPAVPTKKLCNDSGHSLTTISQNFLHG